ncbi:interferon-related developmental regulator 1 [Phoenix dactylifera]|uniref:Interferon-related developmental regulator 1 n=1 Tax=Phoenix dactylifera TaxID=42345 RepID=A0A8B7CSN8_PHODC|nr:interferon-related developmental regulator 1 [Phoenix dactylifera]XP_038975745.1 interferon-related developmental regulator 1 [Phoenix dactylifera]
MGKSNRRKAGADQFDSSDADSVSSTSTALSELTLANETEHVNSLEFVLDKYIDALYEKRGSTRETALLGLLDAFEGHVLLTYVENKCITLLQQYINSIKKGSTKEICLASRAIGLLAITAGAGSNAHEIMEESVPQLSRALKRGSDACKISVLDCLAVISFVGANDLAETETSLKIMWEVIRPKSVSNVGPSKRPSSAVLAAAISTWSFLLTTISSWRINPDTWKESISFLSTLLEVDDRSVRIAAGEAIALFFELGILDMSYSEESDVVNFNNEVKRRTVTYMQSMKAKISGQIYNLSMEAGGKGADKKNLNDQRDLFQKIWDFVQVGERPEVSLRISSKRNILRTSTWSQLIQLNFLKRYLGRGFLKHAQENELLHDVFEYTVDKTESLSAKEKKISRSGDEKGRTQKLNKDRRMAQARKQGHLIAQDA